MQSRPYFQLTDQAQPQSLYNLDLGTTPRNSHGSSGLSLFSFPTPFTSLVLTRCAPGIVMSVSWT